MPRGCCGEVIEGIRDGIVMIGGEGVIVVSPSILSAACKIMQTIQLTQYLARFLFDQDGGSLKQSTGRNCLV